MHHILFIHSSDIELEFQVKFAFTEIHSPPFFFDIFHWVRFFFMYFFVTSLQIIKQEANLLENELPDFSTRYFHRIYFE